MENIYIFKRYEKKYRIDNNRKARLFEQIGNRLTADEHGKSTVYSLYLDTRDYRLIRESLSAETYKEKMRLRCYGVPKSDSPSFLEIKKKYGGVVYKRREVLTYGNATEYINNGKKPHDSQIMRELDYMRLCYGELSPSILIACEREAFFSSENRDLRITLDSGIRYTENPAISNTADYRHIIDDGEYILEIKTTGAMPLWLSAALSENLIFPTPFSKYGTAYKTLKNGGI